MPIKNVSHIAIRVSDLERSRRFYRDVLGFGELTEFTAADGPFLRQSGLVGKASLKVVFMELAGTRIELQALRLDPGTEPPAGQQYGIQQLALRVTELDGELERVAAAGATVALESRVHLDHWGADLVYLYDPDGCRIPLMEMPGDLNVPPGHPISRPPA